MNMESQLKRIASFLTWNHRVSASVLSSRGFYCGGSGDLVVCHRCRLQFDNWRTLEDLEERHRVGPGSCVEGGSRGTSGIGRDQQDAAATDRRPAVLAAGNASGNSIGHSDIRAKLRHSSSSSSTHLTSIDFDQLRSEWIRLETFQDWPLRAARVVDPRDLAEAGLFYTGHGDRVQCAFCRGFLRNWIRGDRPADEHRKHFPDCPFIRELDVGNVRYVETSADTENRPVLSNSAHAVPSYDATFRPTSMTATEAAAARTSQSIHGTPSTSSATGSVKHPQFTELSARIRSYNGKQVGHGQTPEGLAEAGFLHIGPEDNVRCFQCDGGLKNWRPTDDPWTEHARWFPRCPFLLASKDQQFIRDAQIVRNNVPSCTFQHSSSSTRQSSRGQYHVEPREIKARMDSPQVRTVINMGYQREVIRHVVEQRLTSTGDDFPNVQSLLEAVFEYEDGSQGQLTSAAHPTATATDEAAAAAGTQDGASHAQTDNNSRSSGFLEEVVNSENASDADVRAPAAQGNSSGFIEDDGPVDAGTLEALEENRQLREARTCKVCMDQEVDTVFLPCGHLVCCSNCSPALRNCAVCRALIRGTIKIFLS